LKVVLGGQGSLVGRRERCRGQEMRKSARFPYLLEKGTVDESGWAIARLKRGDESGCVGVKAGGGGRCGVTSFERTRDKDASGVLVLFK
jgi:hypothetical protein